MSDDGSSSRILERIEREAGVPGLVEVLAERLSPTDLQSLLLEVYRRRAGKLSPKRLLDRYEHDRFARPADLDPAIIGDVDRLAWSLLPPAYHAVEISPVCPLGTNSVLATVDQNKVVTTIRNSEVVADATNVLALECAVRRRRLLRGASGSHERVCLAASHRLVRGQAYASANARPHFRLLGLCVAGRDEGSFQFETTAMLEQLDFHLRLLQAAGQWSAHPPDVRVAVRDLDTGRRQQALDERVLKPLRIAFPGVSCVFDPDRTAGRGYYVDACFTVYATGEEGAELELVDGGFTTWTQQLLSDRKERLLISGLGTERLAVAR